VRLPPPQPLLPAYHNLGQYLLEQGRQSEVLARRSAPGLAGKSLATHPSVTPAQCLTMDFERAKWHGPQHWRAHARLLYCIK